MEDPYVSHIMNITPVFEELLEKDGSVAIHIRKIRQLVIEIYKDFNE